MPTGGRGGTGCTPEVPELSCTAAFVTLQVNAEVRGLAIYYAEQETIQTPVRFYTINDRFYMDITDRFYAKGALPLDVFRQREQRRAGE